jgi:hypothetical protein
LTQLSLDGRVADRAYIARDPELVFFGGVSCPNQRLGLSLYGPASPIESGAGRPERGISVGIVGSRESTEDTLEWLRRARIGIRVRTESGRVNRFPGWRPDTSLRSSVSSDKRLQIILRDSEIEEAVRPAETAERLGRVTRKFAESFEALRAADPPPDVVICALPDRVVDRCVTGLDRFGRYRRPSATESAILSGTQRRIDDFLPRIEEFEAEAQVGQHYGNLWRGLKIEAMKRNLPLQVIWPRTLRGTAGVQDPATVAWNLFVGIYYKVFGRLWHLAAREATTCYIGLSFFHERTASGDRINCSMAQIFSDTGDGLVFRGGTVGRPPAPGLSPRLDRQTARSLIDKAISLYRTKSSSTDPNRVVVHKTSRFSDDELEGIQSVFESRGIGNWDLVTLEEGSPFYFFRQGRYPPVRGTSLRLTDGRWLVYTKGYVPILGTYSGPAVPRPISLLEHHGTSTSDTVVEDIMSLTRLNWNSSDHACQMPVTLEFSRRVGNVLSEFAHESEPGTQLKYYM